MGFILGKKQSREEIERQAANEIEAIIASGERAPAEWTAKSPRPIRRFGRTPQAQVTSPPAPVATETARTPEPRPQPVAEPAAALLGSEPQREPGATEAQRDLTLVSIDTDEAAVVDSPREPEAEAPARAEAVPDAAESWTADAPAVTAHTNGAPSAEPAPETEARPDAVPAARKPARKRTARPAAAKPTKSRTAPTAGSGRATARASTAAAKKRTGSAARTSGARPKKAAGAKRS